MATNIILFLTNKEDDNIEGINDISIRNQFVLCKVYSFCDMIDAVHNSSFQTLIIDQPLYSFLNDDLLSLFKRKSYYIPNIIVLSDKNIEFSNKDINVVGRHDYKKLEKHIIESLNSFKSKKIERQQNIIQNQISAELEKIGMNQKYKGFKYLSDAIYKIIMDENSGKSFKKYVYPYIASLYAVQEASVERDIRNFLSKNFERNEFKKIINFNENHFSPTTRNIFNALIKHIKKEIQIL